MKKKSLTNREDIKAALSQSEINLINRETTLESLEGYLSELGLDFAEFFKALEPIEDQKYFNLEQSKKELSECYEDLEIYQTLIKKTHLKTKAKNIKNATNS